MTKVFRPEQEQVEARISGHPQAISLTLRSTIRSLRSGGILVRTFLCPGEQFTDVEIVMMLLKQLGTLALAFTLSFGSVTIAQLINNY